MKAIVQAGLLAGSLDMSAAVLNYLIAGGREPVRICYYIASAVFGKETAYAGGWLMASCGLLFHYLIAFTWTALFFLLYPRLALLRKNAVAVGLGYGAFVWSVMNLAVVPLSRINAFPSKISNASLQMAILMGCIGLPVVLLARRYYARK